LKILLVEDELRSAEALEQILKKQSYQVDMTGDGLEAQALAETSIYEMLSFLIECCRVKRALKY
jgi:DNA-binding response OmpR family regulator